MVLNKLKKDKSSKVAGTWRYIHPRLLKEAADAIAKPLSMIYNTSLSSEHVPDQLKDAHIAAIFKKGDSLITTDPSVLLA